MSGLLVLILWDGPRRIVCTEGTAYVHHIPAPLYLCILDLYLACELRRLCCKLQTESIQCRTYLKSRLVSSK